MDNTASQSDMNIVNTMLWMKKNAYKEINLCKVAKLLRHLQRNCSTEDPETVKLYIAKKTTSNGHIEDLIEAYAIHLRSQNSTWEQPFYQRYDKKRRPPKEELKDFIISKARQHAPFGSLARFRRYADLCA